jgi:hypothetical protein
MLLLIFVTLPQCRYNKIPYYFSKDRQRETDTAALLIMEGKEGGNWCIAFVVIIND